MSPQINKLPQILKNWKPNGWSLELSKFQKESLVMNERYEDKGVKRIDWKQISMQMLAN